MKRLISPLILILGCLLALSGCSTPEERNDRLERRLDRREDRVGRRLDRMDVRGEARAKRWQRMKGYEQDRYDQMWDNLMN